MEEEIIARFKREAHVLQRNMTFARGLLATVIFATVAFAAEFTGVGFPPIAMRMHVNGSLAEGNALALMMYWQMQPFIAAEDTMRLMTTSAPSDYSPYGALDSVGTQREIANEDVVWMPKPSMALLIQSIWTWLAYGKAFVFHIGAAIPNLYMSWELKQSDLFPFRAISSLNTDLTVPHNYVVMSEATAAYLDRVIRPNWRLHLPAGHEVVTFRTELGWLVGRNLVRNVDDLVAVHALQDQTSYRPIADVLGARNLIVSMLAQLPTPTPRHAYVPHALSPVQLMWFDKVGQYLMNDPPIENFGAMWYLLRRMGITEAGFNASDVDAHMLAGMVMGFNVATQVVAEKNCWTFGTWTHGWAHINNSALYTDKADWATFATFGKIGFDGDREIYYALSPYAADMQLLVGGKNYTMHFSSLPPTLSDGFWSLSIYGWPGGRVIPHPRRTWTITSFTNLATNEDGSFDIKIMNTDPADFPLTNVLSSPTDPEERFQLVMHIYHAGDDVINRVWQEPWIVPF